MVKTEAGLKLSSKPDSPAVESQTAGNRSPFSEEFARTVLDSLSAHIAVLDDKGVILETNRAWQQYAGRNDMKESADSVGID